MFKKIVIIAAALCFAAGPAIGAPAKAGGKKSPSKPAVKTAAKPVQKAVPKRSAANSYQAALAAHKKGDLKTAISHYNTAVRAEKRMWQAWLGLGMCYYSMKKYNNALLIFKHVLALKPGEPAAQRYVSMLQGGAAKTSASVKKESRTKGEIMWRSALLPGAGQFYNNEPAKGYVYSLGYLASIGAIIKYSIDREAAVSAYKNATDRFDEKYKTAEEAGLRVIIPVAIAGVIWTVSVLDGFLSGEEEKKPGTPGRAAADIFMPDSSTIGIKLASLDF